MIPIGRLVPLTVVALCAVGCSQSRPEDHGSGGFQSALVAEKFAKDCESPEALRQAPNEQMRRHLHRLCSCTKKRIANTPISLWESDDSTNRKVNAAGQACYDEIGGAPGEGRLDDKRRSGH